MNQPRLSALNIQTVAEEMRQQLYPNTKHEPSYEDVDKAIRELKSHDMFIKGEVRKEPVFQLPRLQGADLHEHFNNLALQQLSPYLSEIQAFAKLMSPPPMPTTWAEDGGWTKYLPDGQTKQVPYPEENIFVFDTEWIVRMGGYPYMAVALSPTHWYSWKSRSFNFGTQNLIPIGKNKLIIAHMASADRARCEDEYTLEETGNRFLDTLSMHVCVSGIAGKQRNVLLALKSGKTDIDWGANLAEHGAMNNLAECYKFHCHRSLDKAARDWFVTGTLQEVTVRQQELFTYCALDTKATFELYQALWVKFRKACPSPVTLAGMLEMSTAILPLGDWERYKADAQATYNQYQKKVRTDLTALVEKAIADYEPWLQYQALPAKEREGRVEPASPMSDPWLKNLDWTIKPKVRKHKGMPEWWREIVKDGEFDITTRKRCTPYLLRLQWQTFPLMYLQWMEGEIKDDKGTREHREYFCSEKDEKRLKGEGYSKQGSWGYVIPFEKFNPSFHNKPVPLLDGEGFWVKIPHQDGDDANAGNPLAKGYLDSLEAGVLNSEYEQAANALKTAIACSYWDAVNSRVYEQFVVYKDVAEAKRKVPFIIPQFIVAGTVTRRAVEALWLTCSNPKKNRIGSEIKSLVQAPAGWAMVAADVDGQEARLCSMLGDSYFAAQHGATVLGVQTLLGNKEEGSDIHSATAKILGISRDNAKTLNYARFYGSGVKNAATNLKKFNSTLSEKECEAKARDLFRKTKGTKVYPRKAASQSNNEGFDSSWLGSTHNEVIDKSEEKVWQGGTESFTFNKLEQVAKSAIPTSPILNVQISTALREAAVGNGYTTSKVNWTVQSSGVDFLHLALVALRHLINEFQLKSHFIISIHDEWKHLVKDEQKYQMAYAYSVAHCWTWAYACQQLGIPDLPLAYAYYEAVEVDKVQRKNAKDPQLTPSNSVPVPPGESLSIFQILEKAGISHEARIY